MQFSGRVSWVKQSADAETIINVWIDIDGNFLSIGACGFDPGDRQIHLSPVALTGGFQMENVNGCVGGGTDTERLVYRFQQAITFVARVCEVTTAVLVLLSALDLRNLLLRSIDRRRIN